MIPSRGARMVGAAVLAVALLTAPIVRAEEIAITQWGQSLYGAPFAVAMEKGLFKKAGIDITGIIGSAGGGTTVRNILAGATPYGEVALPAALAAARGRRSGYNYRQCRHQNNRRIDAGDYAGHRNQVTRRPRRQKGRNHLTEIVVRDDFSDGT
jgi:hypothetical protein